ncbi:carbon catabolite repressor protein 4 homolog 6 [Andrographis paniculata]|uniref:carbon catabolite repressor protein 4 homolog 6 n=1 Tax=Andrographis paniculata TaxID=175694 RepID=UPI0021E6EEE5|nr:carbon catabolite repressor protein 4 homolog 6 [Andrographis paniculata]
MNRRPASLRSLAVAATGDTVTSTVMSSRPCLRGRRPQHSRGFSDKPLNSTSGEFVSGDSHFQAVRTTNRGFRPSYNAVPPPPRYGTGHNFYVSDTLPHRHGPPYSQQFPGQRPYRHPQQAGPAFGNSQQFRPQQMRPQFRPRPSKPPDYRHWEYAKTVPPPNCELFTVLSYNILADYLVNDHWHKLYFHIPRNIMEWNWRKRSLCFELGLWSADILCFQEVDRFQDLKAELNTHGYDGIWKMRTGDPVDGCAIFWRASRFKLLHEESIEYNRFGLRDNVAQICVFESRSELKKSDAASTLSTSTECSNRVVVCNIHVLFNPKRGDVKLGQIRLLLERAHAISKRWDHAPVVICGDFNCTPKSPMYNFIKEQKLDLSELPRNKVSGQETAQLHPSFPPYPDYRKEASVNSMSTSQVNGDKPEQVGFPVDAQKIAGLCSSTDSVANNSKSVISAVDKTSESSIGKECEGRSANDLANHYTTDSFASENISKHGPPESLHGRYTSVQNDAKPSIGVSGGDLDSSSIDTKATGVGECYESQLQSPDNKIEISSLPDDHSSDFARTSEFTGTNNSDTPKVEETYEKLPPHSLDVAFSEHKGTASAAIDSRDRPSIGFSLYDSVSADFALDEKFELLSLSKPDDCSRDEPHEDSETFLSELHYGESLFSDDLGFSSSNQKLHSNIHPNLHDPLYVEDEIIVNATDVHSSWTPAEIQTATGSSDCKVMEHPLKLSSTYAEVESPSGSRDSSGEPLMTSYHRRFAGTVDYIW